MANLITIKSGTKIIQKFFVHTCILVKNYMPLITPKLIPVNLEIYLIDIPLSFSFLITRFLFVLHNSGISEGIFAPTIF